VFVLFFSPDVTPSSSVRALNVEVMVTQLLKVLRYLPFKFPSVVRGPLLWFSSHNSWLQIQRSRVRFSALPDFLTSIESEMRPAQPRKDN
jgi:hypothetical protein